MTNTGEGARADGAGFHIERDLLCTVNSDGYFTSLNSGWERLLGWTREELMSRPIIDFIHPADRTRAVDELAKVTSADYEVVNFENRYRSRGGGWRWLRWSARTDGESWFAVAFDVTGPAGGTWTLVRESERWALFEGAADRPECRLVLDQDTAWRLFFKALSADTAVPSFSTR